MMLPSFSTLVKKQGFPSMLGSLACMHWKWKNYPTAWAGQYPDRSGSPTIILETVADYDLWHAYFGILGTNNYINVLESYHLFFKLLKVLLLQLIMSFNEKNKIGLLFG